MSGLVGYGSSDEEDDSPGKQSPVHVATQRGGIESTDPDARDTSVHHLQHGVVKRNGDQHSVVARGPSLITVSTPDREHSESTKIGAPNSGDDEGSTIADPRTACRNLTLPTVPNLEIPGSPPGSPPAIMMEKVKRFLELKQQGIHFNEKLASSSSLKNPSLLGKLSTFAGLDPADQYATTLPTDLWDPKAFPHWTFKEELGKAQEQAVKLREEERAQGLRPGVEFVAAEHGRLQLDNGPTMAQRATYRHVDRQLDRGSRKK